MPLLELDRIITFGLYNSRIGSGYEQLFYSVASLFVYLLPLTLIFLFFRSYKDRLNSLKVLITSIFAWRFLSYSLGTLLYQLYGFRDRPFAEFGIQELFFERPEKAFPSDHAAILMTAAILFFYYRYPKLGWLFLIGGLISSLSRVVIGFHWFGDVVGGWLVALMAFGLLKLFEPTLDRGLNWLLNRFKRD